MSQQQKQGVWVVFNPSYAAGLMALAERWEISAAAVARRIIREVLREHGVLHRPQPLSQNRDSTPRMVHRTLRITPKQASFFESTARSYRISRSETIRGVLAHAIGRPITYEHLRRVPSERRTVRWSVRITHGHDAHIRKVAKLLMCSGTDAAAAVLASMAARRHFLASISKQNSLNTV